MSDNNFTANNKAVLPLFLRPIKGADLVRIGRDNDGGYLVDKRSIISSEFLLGFGIYDDWSFEKDFIKYVDVPVVAFDASVGQNFFLKKLRTKIINFLKLLITMVYHFFMKLNMMRLLKNLTKQLK